MGYGFITAGLAFLFVPQFGVYDFMPDCIGFALILIGLSKTSKINGDLQNASRNFRYLFFLTLAKLMLTFPLSSLNDETTSMLFVFCFAVAEVVFLLPAFSSLCEGSYYISSRAGCPVPDRAYNDFRLTARIFVIARAALAALPELTVLANNAYKESLTAEELERPTVYDSKHIITLAAFVISFLIGTVFIILALRYFSALMKDKNSLSEIKRRCDAEIPDSAAARAYAAAKTSSSLFTAGCVFMMTLYFYGVDFLPDVIGAAFMIAGFLFLRKVVETKKAVISAVLCAAVTAAATAVEYYTANRYFTDASYITAESYNAYLISASLKAAGYLIFALLLYYVYRCFCIIIKKHTKAPSFDEAGYKNRQYMRCRILCIAGVVACGVSAVCGFLFAYSELFRFAALLVFGAYSIYLYAALSKICGEVSKAAL